MIQDAMICVSILYILIFFNVETFFYNIRKFAKSKIDKCGSSKFQNLPNSIWYHNKFVNLWKIGNFPIGNLNERIIKKKQKSY